MAATDSANKTSRPLPSKFNSNPQTPKLLHKLLRISEFLSKTCISEERREMLYRRKRIARVSSLNASVEPESYSEFKLNTLYLKLSAIFGIFPIGKIRGDRWKYWPLITTWVLTSINVASIAMNSYSDYKRWMANVKDLLNDFALILAATNLNVCVILHNVIAMRRSTKLGRLLKQLDQSKPWPSLMAVFEIACMTTSVANFIVTRYPKMLQIAGAVIRIMLTYLAMLILVQYSAFLGHFSKQIRQLTHQLRYRGKRPEQNFFTPVYTCVCIIMLNLTQFVLKRNDRLQPLPSEIL